MKYLMILITTMPILASTAFGQTYDRKYTAAYINSKTTDECKLFIEKKNIRIEFNNNGNPVRIDYIFPKSINYENSLVYSKDEGALVFQCYSEAGKCINREIPKHGSKLIYDRSNLLLDCTPEEGEALAEAGKHLIQLYINKRHTRSEPFDK